MTATRSLPDPTPTVNGAAAVGVASVVVVGRRSPRLATLGGWLVEEGCTVAVVGRLDEVLGPASLRRPDVVLLDLGASGPAVIAGLRTWTDLPVIAVGRGRAEGLEAALGAGADDYLALPLSRPEVRARIRAVLGRRRSPRVDGAVGPGAVVATPDFELDLVTRHATAAGATVRLTPTEWRVVEVLVRRAGVLVSQADVLAMVWGGDTPTQSHALRVHLSSIRHKLEPDPRRPLYFTTETGAGLRYVSEPVSPTPSRERP